MNNQNNNNNISQQRSSTIVMLQNEKLTSSSSTLMKAMHDYISNDTAEITEEERRQVMERMVALGNFGLNNLNNKDVIRKVKQDFSKLCGIDDICINFIIPYLCDDTVSLINMFAKTTKRFLNVLLLHHAYYKIILPRKYGNNPGFEMIHGSKYGTLTLKDAKMLVHQYDRDLTLVGGKTFGRHQNCLHVAGLNGYLSIVKFLIEEFNMNIHALDGNGKSIIYLSAFHGKTDIVKYLLSKGGDLSDKKKGFLDGLKNRYILGTPLVCACEKGRLEDVQLLITCRNDLNGGNFYNNNMTVKEYVSQVRRNSYGSYRTPLMTAAENEHFQVVQYLIEQGEADPNIADSEYGVNALHLAARYNRTNTKVIELLLTNMPLNSINKKDRFRESTPLDYAYDNKSPIQQKIIDLIRSKGGKRKSEFLEL